MSMLFGETRQLGMVVRDIDQALGVATRQLGIGPFCIMREIRPDWFRYRGQPSASPLLSLAFAFTGDLQVEIIQQHDDAPSGFLDFIRSGREGAQHLASWVASRDAYEQACDKALASGAPILHEGQIGPGRFTYFDTADTALGLCYEISEGLIPEYAGVSETYLQKSKEWDGRDPIQPFG